MGVNAANAGTAGTSWGGPSIRNKNGPISARNLRRIEKKKSQKTKEQKNQRDIVLFLDKEGKINEFPVSNPFKS